MISTCFLLQGQTDGSVSKKVRKAEQKKEELKKKKERSEIEGRKRHESIQTEETRKRMRKHRKQHIHVDAYERRPFFLKRWFQKKEHSTKK